MRLLGQGACNQHQLAFAAADLGVARAGQMQNAKIVERFVGDAQVILARRCKRSQMRGAGHEHNLANLKVEGRNMHLRHIAKGARQPAPRPIGNRLLAKAHATESGPQQVQNHFEQRRLAAAVGAQQANHFAGMQREADIVHHGSGTVSAGHVLQGQVHDLCLRSRMSRKRKNGAPINAVRIPTGISNAPAVRATSSTNSRKPPPMIAAAGNKNL